MKAIAEINVELPKYWTRYPEKITNELVSKASVNVVIYVRMQYFSLSFL